MERSCIRCGRFIEVFDERYRSRQAEFDRSIQDLEAMLGPFLEEIEKVKSELEELERNDPPPPPFPDLPWRKP